MLYSDAWRFTYRIDFGSFRISRFHGSISHSEADHRVGRSAYDNTKDFSLKIIAMTFSYFSLSWSLRSKLTSCRFPGISERNVQNAVAASQHRTGWGGRESSCFIWPASPVTSAAGNYQQVNNLHCWTIGFYANHIIWRTSTAERRPATVSLLIMPWIFISPTSLNLQMDAKATVITRTKPSESEPLSPRSSFKCCRQTFN